MNFPVTVEDINIQLKNLEQTFIIYRGKRREENKF